MFMNVTTGRRITGLQILGTSKLRLVLVLVNKTRILLPEANFVYGLRGVKLWVLLTLWCLAFDYYILRVKIEEKIMMLKVYGLSLTYV